MAEAREFFAQRFHCKSEISVKLLTYRESLEGKKAFNSTVLSFDTGTFLYSCTNRGRGPNITEKTGRDPEPPHTTVRCRAARTIDGSPSPGLVCGLTPSSVEPDPRIRAPWCGARTHCKKSRELGSKSSHPP